MLSWGLIAIEQNIDHREFRKGCVISMKLVMKSMQMPYARKMLEFFY